MAGLGDRRAAAGLLRCDDRVQEPDRPAAEVADGSTGVRNELWGLSRDKGENLWKHELKQGLVPEGLAAAGGRIYVSSVDGRVICLGAR